MRHRRGIRCPHCGARAAKITAVRPDAAGERTVRFKRCYACGRRFSTEESLRAKIAPRPTKTSTM